MLKIKNESDHHLRIVLDLAFFNARFYYLKKNLQTFIRTKNENTSAVYRDENTILSKYCSVQLKKYERVGMCLFFYEHHARF